MNGIDAMRGVEDERRIVTIAGQRDQLAGQPSVRITVQDLGSGIEPEALERLFEAFYSTKPHGMGMGLRISRSLVEAMAGVCGLRGMLARARRSFSPFRQMKVSSSLQPHPPRANRAD
jgi:signal transduction histidine kinase